MLRMILNMILSMLLVITTAGFSISKHFCGDKVVSVSLNKEAPSCCNNAKACNSCHNESQHFQLKTDFITSSNYVNLDDISENILTLTPELFQFSVKEFEDAGIFHVFTDTSPPLKILTHLANLQTFLL